ncbi:50S ribosomal protein L9 [Neomicrococcus lactis]|uniref:Large ribosomal subunit protein bL9 n=1 Tax=Neomicrococcus lactis TaxID=732241 RepID=A0A7W9DC83_9MICC|nr:50S ribosomal protein L9 [Neomicrococcus lactis]MBB5598896.1 large subunit ribosomal protein L9 [Neomicrococcus lactis]
MAKLILTHEVTGLGTPGDVVEVKNGYARNYLLPRGFATLWTKGAEKHVEALNAARAAKAIANLEDAQALAAKLKSTTIRLAVKAGDTGRLFGTVKPADIAAAIEEAGLGSLDRRSIEIQDAIKSVGHHNVTARLHEDVLAAFEVQVVAAKGK